MKMTLLAAILAVTPGLAPPASAPTPRPAPAAAAAADIAERPIPENDADCDLCDGARLMHAGQHERAMHVFQLLAAKGDVDAMNNIGWMYEYGLGRPVDLTQALAWYRKSADLGGLQGALNTAKMYENGRGVPVDRRIAAKYYAAAAAHHDLTTTAVDMGFAYQHGMGVPVDYAKARALYWQAANEDGDSLAMNQIGFMIEHGLGAPANPAQAWCWYTWAAANGHAAAAAHLAEIEARHQEPTAPGACEIINHPPA